MFIYGLQQGKLAKSPGVKHMSQRDAADGRVLQASFYPALSDSATPKANPYYAKNGMARSVI